MKSYLKIWYGGVLALIRTHNLASFAHGVTAVYNCMQNK